VAASRDADDRARKNGLENEYDTAKVVAWMVQRELARSQSRERLDRIRAEREELALRKDLGELVSVELSSRCWTATCGGRGNR
jgi:hypothetical protein